MTRAGVAAAALLLAGCARLEALNPFAEADSPPPEPAATPAPEPAATPAPEPIPVPEPVPVPAPEPPPADALLGMTAAELTTAFGPPALERREPGARLLQFAAACCVLDVALYREAPEGADTPFRARHVAARSRTGDPLAAQDCMAVLLPEERWAQLAGSE